MFRLVWFVFRVIFRLKVVLLSVAAGAAIAGGIQVLAQSRTWGLLPGDAERQLPGDDLVVGPQLVETRSLVIEAAATQVWPWLVQMGFERGGWYSFAPLDRAWSPGGGAPRHSSETILPKFQDLAVGDIVPTHPGGGFVVRVVDPGAALVLYLDDVMVRDQAQEQTADHPVADGEGVRDMDMPTFGVSWAFVLDVEPDGGTRLVERIRMHIKLTAPQQRGVPMLGLGLFTLMRSQMLGIKRRSEGMPQRDA